MIEEMVEEGQMEVLLANDQLLKHKSDGDIFQGMNEGRLTFKPTFKFDQDSDAYDTSQKGELECDVQLNVPARVPSWTDRILYRGEPIIQHYYKSEPSVRYSDHRPVVAGFSTCYDKSQITVEASTEQKVKTYSIELTNVQSKVCTIQ